MSSSTSPLSQAEMIAGFKGDISGVRVPIVYRAALVLVALAMVLLPLAYVVLIVASGYGVYYHAVHHVTMLEGEGSGKFRALVYVTPIVVGTILVLFMIKPLFARPARGAKPHTLKRDDERTLFAFVDRICQAVGAPAPREIRVDCAVNASASFRHGLLSFVGNDLALTIGLPLVSGLSLRQLAGVLAHEFGHFSQGVGMRLTYVIRSVNHWFSRVVYERDAWDLRLERWAKGLDFRIGVILHLARFFVWLTRRILFALMWIGHVISCFMLRQMEYDADRHETHLVGSKTFESTALRLHLINAANQKAHGDLRSSWTEGRLADDLPGLIGAWLDRIPESAAGQVRENLEHGKTGLFDTHPCDADRVRRSARENTEGIFRLAAPATVLLHDYTALSKAVTRLHYRGLLGEEVDPSSLVSSAPIAADEDARQKAYSQDGSTFKEVLGSSVCFFGRRPPATSTTPILQSCGRRWRRRAHG